MEDDVGTVAPSSAHGGLDNLRVSLSHSKACVCCLCNAKSTDASPLVGAEAGDRFGGARPWAKYGKRKDAANGDELVRVPEGKCCSFCFSTFRALGLDYKYPTYAAYYKEIRDNAEKHTKFLQSVKEYISLRNANPSGRIDKEAVKKAQTTLESESKTGVKLKGPKKEFVMLEHWDSKLDGELDESKVVEEFWQGKKVKGIWRNKGRVGVLEGSQYEDTNLSERTKEHSGLGPFAAEALENKKQVLQKVFASAEEEREKHTVAARPAAMSHDSVMEALSKLIPGLPGASKVEVTEPEADASHASELCAADEGSEQEEEEDMDVCPADRLAAKLGKAVPKAKAKASAPSKAKAICDLSQKQPKQKLHKAAVPVRQEGRGPGKGNVAGQAAAPPSETLQLDGRGKRLKENLADIHSKLLQQLTDNHLEVNFSLQQEDAKQAFSKKQKALNSLLNSTSKQIKKIEDSVNKAGLLDELENFQTLQDAIQHLLELLAKLNIANPAWQELSEAVEACESSKFAIELGQEVWLKMLHTKCAHFCLYQDFTQYATLFRSDQKEAGCRTLFRLIFNFLVFLLGLVAFVCMPSMTTKDSHPNAQIIINQTCKQFACF